MTDLKLNPAQTQALSRVTTEWATCRVIGAPDATLKALARRNLIEARVHGWSNEYRLKPTGIRVTIKDMKSLSAVNPIDVLSYLEAKGWQRRRVSDYQVVYVLSQPNLGEFEVVVPLDNMFVDYSIRVAELIQTLEIVEARSQLDVLEDITNSREAVHDNDSQTR